MLKKYKKNCPNVSLLVIGPGDMGYKSGGELHTYGSAIVLNEWMKELSLKNGVAYFDFYTLMQREGGILAWKEKGLASLDGHLTPSGQKKFAKIVTKELSTAYSAYKIGKDKIKEAEKTSISIIKKYIILPKTGYSPIMKKSSHLALFN
jgi:hypothetical protein